MARPMTREGYEAIESEIDHLWSVERPEIVRQVTAAAELGDRSENAAYIYGKKRLREIDSRIRYLRRKIDEVHVVDVGAVAPSPQVRFGAIVVVETDDEQRFTWRLVDKEESDPGRGRISVQAPVGRALLGKEAGDVVDVNLPKGTRSYEIIEVRYGPGDP